MRISAPDVSRVSTLRAAYAGGLSAHVVVDAVLERLAARGDDGVWISRFDAAALHARAAAIEERWAPDDRPPLFGVPFAVKDNIDVAGLPTTAACPAFSYSPAVDATSVRLLLDAGAIAVGKTNLDQFATGLNGTRSPYGAPGERLRRRPDLRRVELGQRRRGGRGRRRVRAGHRHRRSGRVPAALNGIVGLKPTRGLVSTAGVVPPAVRSTACRCSRPTSTTRSSCSRCWPGPTPPTRGRAYRSRRHGVPRSAAARASACVADSAGRRRRRARRPRVRRGVPAGRRRGVDARPVPLDPLFEAGDLLYDGPWVAERLAGLGRLPRRRTPTTSCRSRAR